MLGAESKTDGRSERSLANAAYRLVAYFRELGEMIVMAILALGQKGKLGGKFLPTVEKAHTHEMQGRLYSEEERLDRGRMVITEFPFGWVRVMLGLWGSGCAAAGKFRERATGWRGLETEE